MKFTGERVVPGDGDHADLYHEHLARYFFAAQYVKGARVLDLGCGTGYGSKILADSGTAEVVAVDISDEALSFAAENYSAANLRFEKADIAKPTPEWRERFDRIVCFEVMEHLTDQRALIENISTYMAPGGLLILSTPNPGRMHAEENPHHVHEPTRAELESMFGKCFTKVALLGQQRLSGVSFSVESAEKSLMLLGGSAGDDPPDYHLVLAGDLPELKATLFPIPYYQDLQRLLSHLEGMDQDRAQLGRTLEARQKELEEKSAWARNLSVEAENLQQEIQDRDVAIENLRREKEQAESHWGYRYGRKVQRALDGGLSLARLFAGWFASSALMVPALALGALKSLWRLLLLLGILPPTWRLSRELVASGKGPGAVFEPPDDKGYAEGISVVIPTWNGRELLQQCLPGLIAACEKLPLPVEVIVADGASNDDTGDWLAENFPSVRHLLLDSNRGFAGNANAGAAAAKGRWLLFLNNDMIPEGDFISPLLPHMKDDKLFAVACALETKQGVETGNTRGRFNGGRLLVDHLPCRPGDPPSTIFYAGGGAALFRGSLFERFGGFDGELFAPFYAEDLALSWFAAKQGYRVILEPKSRIFHKHRATVSKRLDAEKADELLQKNMLLATWAAIDDPDMIRQSFTGFYRRLLSGRLPFAVAKAALASRDMLLKTRTRRPVPVLSDEDIFRRSLQPIDAEVNRDGRLNILALSPYSLLPADHGGAKRMFELLSRLAKIHRVDLCSLVEKPSELDYRDDLLKIFSRVELVLRGGAADPKLTDPNAVAEFRLPCFERAVAGMLATRKYDIVQAEYPNLAHFLPPGGPKTVITQIDVLHLTVLRAAKIAKPGGRAALAYEGFRLHRYERQQARRADCLLAMSEQEAEYIRNQFGVDARVCPNGIDTASITHQLPRRDSKELLFVGNFRHPPNVEGLLHFVRESWPIIRRGEMSARLIVVGPSAPDEIRALAVDPGISIEGRVEDLALYYRRAAIAVVPILRGSGTRLKILEAFAFGTPVVSTFQGAEGIDAADGREIILADSGADFAAVTLALLGDYEKAVELSKKARRLVESKYDWDIIAGELCEIYRQVTGGGAGEGGD